MTVIESILLRQAKAGDAAETVAFFGSGIAGDAEIDSLTRAIDAGSDLSENLPKLGEVLLTRDRLTEARAVFEYLLAQSPDDITILKRLCRIERQLGNTRQALDYLRAVTVAEPENVEFLAEFGAVLNDAQMTGEAAGVYRRILELDRHHAAAHLGLAWIARAQGKSDLARAHFQAAIGRYRELVDNNSGGAEARVQLASGLRAIGLLDEAENLFAELLAAGTAIVASRRGLGWIAHARKDSAAAVRHFRAAAAAAPGNLHARLDYARLLRETEDFAEAAREYGQIATLWPRNPEIQAALSMLLGRHGDWKSAVAHWRAACLLAPHNIVYRLDMARACGQAEDWAAAEAAYAEALALDPASLDAFLGLGEMANIRGDAVAAIAWYEKAALAVPADLRPKTELRKLRSGHDWRAELRDAIDIANLPVADSSSRLEAATLLVEYGLTEQASSLLSRVEGSRPAVNKLQLAIRQIERMGLAQVLSPDANGAIEFDSLHGLVERPVPDAETLLFVFGGTNNRLWMTFSLLHRLLQPSGSSIVYVRDLRRDWYRSGLEGLGHDFASAAEALMTRAKRYGARRLLMLGNCVGCFGALRFGLALGAEGVLALSPKLRPGDEFNPGQKATVSAIKARLPEDHLNIHDRYATAPRRPQVNIVYAEQCIADAADANYMADLSDIRIQAIPGSAEPDSVKELLMRGLLAPVLDEFVATGSLSADLCARIASSGAAPVA